MTKTKIAAIINESRKRSAVYETRIMEAGKTFRELDSSNMQAMLIQIEDFIDNSNMYAYQNWIEGALWDGPDVSRYWISFTLKYDEDKMPDPRAATRLINVGAKVKFEESSEIKPIEHASKKEKDTLTKKPIEEEHLIWLVHFKIPRRLIEDVAEIEETPIEATVNAEAGSEADQAGENEIEPSDTDANDEEF